MASPFPLSGHSLVLSSNTWGQIIASEFLKFLTLNSFILFVLIKKIMHSTTLPSPLFIFSFLGAHISAPYHFILRKGRQVSLNFSLFPDMKLRWKICYFPPLELYGFVCENNNSTKWIYKYVKLKIRKFQVGSSYLVSQKSSSWVTSVAKL